MLTEETLVAEQIRSLFYDGVLPEVDYDAFVLLKMKILTIAKVNMVNLTISAKNN